MTTISTNAAFGMIPLWLFTLGQTLDVEGQKITIPFVKIVEALAIIVLPLFFGLFLQYRVPKLAKVITKVMKPVLIVAVAFLLTVGIYANLYIFRLFDPMTVLAGCLLPYIGYTVGGLLALIFRQPWTRVKTIALETGIQNSSVAFLTLIFSFPPPGGELAAVGPAASAVMTPLPPFILSIAYLVYNKVKGKPSPRQREKELKRTVLSTLEKEVVVEHGFEGESGKREAGSGKENNMEEANAMLAPV
nr:hypothetical protein BaRGS_009741 [Batillaria attramentaria]KAG5690279.1 hypothetical protein BaRGS_018631 [Batillaria attramentaria]